MDCLDYESDNNGSDDVILEDSDCEYDCDMQYEKVDNSAYVAMSDLEFIAAHAVDVPVYAPTTVVNNATAAADIKATSNGNDSCDEESSDSDDDDGNDMIQDEAESSSSSDSEYEPITKGKSFRSMLTEEEEESVAAGPPKTKNELLESVLYPTDVSKVNAEEELLKVGEVLYRIDHECVIVVQAYYTNCPLNESSMLCNESGVVMGRVHEVFGPITTPYYIVRWEAAASQKTEGKKNNGSGNNNKKNSKKKAAAASAAAEETLYEGHANEPMDDVVNIEGSANEEADTAVISETAVATESDVPTSQPVVVVDTLQQVRDLFSPGTVVFAAKSRSSFVTPGVLLQQHGKGSDASNAHDEEVSVLTLLI